MARFAIFRLNDLLMWLKRQDDTDVSALLALPDQHRYLADLPHRTGPRPPLVRWCVFQPVGAKEVPDVGSHQACTAASGPCPKRGHGSGEYLGEPRRRVLES